MLYFESKINNLILFIMEAAERFINDICIDENKDNITKSVDRWMKDYFENPSLFLELCSVFSVGQIGKAQLIHGKNDSYRINSFLYEHVDYTAIVRTFTPLYRGTRPMNKIQVEILR